MRVLLIIIREIL